MSQLWRGLGGECGRAVAQLCGRELLLEAQPGQEEPATQEDQNATPDAQADPQAQSAANADNQNEEAKQGEADGQPNE